MTEITLEQWAKERHHKIERFMRVWGVCRNADPMNYLDKMPPGDWGEQFDIFDGM